MDHRTDVGSRVSEDPETLSLQRWWRVILGWTMIGAGGLLILLGWIGVSGDPHVARQMSYIASGGIGGLAAAVVGVGLLISEDLRADRRRLGRIEGAILDVQTLLHAQSDSLAQRNGSEIKDPERSGGSRRSR
jgi:hypothetical protein